MEHGLSSLDAKKKLNEFGFNELPTLKRKNWFKIFKDVFKEPMFILLVISSLVYMVLGNFNEGIILLGAFSIIIIITYYQNLKTEKSLESLRRLSSPKANVIRDGTEFVIPGREIVPDDIIIVNEGERISADAVLLDGVNLLVDESLLTGESVPISKHENTTEELIYSGTLVVQGKAMAKVIATGVHTKFGEIGKSLATIEQIGTPLQLKMKKLVRNFFLVGLLLSITVSLGIFFTRGNLIASILNGIAVSMAILPEEFPVILTVFFALGAWKLTRNNVLTQTPAVLETLGSTSVLCADKTGTITQNKMEVAMIYCGNQFYLKNEFEVNRLMINDFLFVAHTASQENSKDPMEQAISSAFLAHNSEAEIPTLVKQYPLSRELTAMTRVLNFSEDIASNVSAKGSPEAIFTLCKLSEEVKKKHLSVAHQMADKGFRIIAVAVAHFSGDNLPETQHGFDFSLLGFLGLEDPIRPEVPNAVKECIDAGIHVVMITGDFPVTARSIANQIGLNPTLDLLKGEELDKMSDSDLKERVKKINVFARVVPEQKLRIVNAFKSNGDIVAMTGDGVNDAPALKAAHIGIAMGMKGTDVAREASALILLDDNFASIVAAIRNGRKIFDNLQKAMSYVLSIHIPIIGLALIPSFFSFLPIVLMPLHIVLLELVVDPVCSVAFESEQEEKSIMKKPPRNPKASFFEKKIVFESLFSGFGLLTVVSIIYLFFTFKNYASGEIRAVTFSTLMFGNIFLILTKLSNTRSFAAVFKERNFAAWALLFSAFIMLFIVLYVPGLNAIFDFKRLGFFEILIAFLSSLILLIVFELRKLLNKNNSLYKFSDNLLSSEKEPKT